MNTAHPPSAAELAATKKNTIASSMNQQAFFTKVHSFGVLLSFKKAMPETCSAKAPPDDPGNDLRSMNDCRIIIYPDALSLCLPGPVSFVALIYLEDERRSFIMTLASIST